MWFGDVDSYFSPNCLCFFFNDTATTEIYTLSLHDALPISFHAVECPFPKVKCVFHIMKWNLWEKFARRMDGCEIFFYGKSFRDRKSTRLNSSHANISYAVFCLKKKKH